MTRLKPAAWSPTAAPASTPASARRAAALTLQAASALLAGLASRLMTSTARAPSVPEPRFATLEFYADAGAPEGALYADGYLVGWVEGVQRL